MIGPKSFVVLAVSLAISSADGVAFADDAPAFTTLWRPPGISSSRDTTAMAFARLRVASRGSGLPAPGRTEKLRIDAGGKTIDADASVLGDDYAVRAVLDGNAIALGRARGFRWRANSAGTVHVIRADVQGDSFDRWPVTDLGFLEDDCTLIGTAMVPKPAWVLRDQPAYDIPRWLFVDEATGDIVREISREGSRIVTYDFSDVRGTAPDRRPYAWTISGAGGVAKVTLLDTTPATVASSDVAPPPQGQPVFSTPVAARRLTADFSQYGEIFVKLRLDGKQRVFILDSGTPELILNGPVARDVGQQTLGHGVAETIDVDDSVAKKAPFIAVDFWADGLLGYDFFRGRIVHVDYATQRVDVLPRDGFDPPANALSVETDWSEGMPLVRASVGERTGDRFALDIGSGDLVLSNAFMERAGPSTGVTRIGAKTHALGYLEGPIQVAPASVSSLVFGTLRIKDYVAQVEVPNADNLSIPLDGIIGIRNFSRSEWWFDADGTTTWYRPEH